MQGSFSLGKAVIKRSLPNSQPLWLKDSQVERELGTEGIIQC